MLIAGSADMTVWMWNADTGVCMLVFTGHSGALCEVKFAPDGERAPVKQCAWGGVITGVPRRGTSQAMVQNLGVWHTCVLGCTGSALQDSVVHNVKWSFPQIVSDGPVHVGILVGGWMQGPVVSTLLVDGELLYGRLLHHIIMWFGLLSGRQCPSLLY